MGSINFSTSPHCCSLLFIQCLFCSHCVLSSSLKVDDDGEQSAVNALKLPDPAAEYLVESPSTPGGVLAEFVKTLSVDCADIYFAYSNEDQTYLEVSDEVEEDSSCSTYDEALAARHGGIDWLPLIDIGEPVLSLGSESWEQVLEEYTACQMAGGEKGSVWILRIYEIGFELELGNVLMPTKTFSLFAAHSLGLIKQDRLTLKELETIKNDLVRKSVTGRLSQKTRACFQSLKKEVHEGYYLNLDSQMPLEVLFPILKKLGLQRVDHRF